MKPDDSEKSVFTKLRSTKKNAAQASSKPPIPCRFAETEKPFPPRSDNEPKDTIPNGIISFNATWRHASNLSHLFMFF